MILRGETNDHLQCILSCLSDHLKYPKGNFVSLVSTVDGGTVISSSSFLCLVSQHLSSVLRDRESFEDDATVLLPVQSSLIFKMMEFISTGKVTIDTIEEVLEFGKLVQIMGIVIDNIDVKDARENCFLDSKIESASVCKGNMNTRRVKAMKKVNGKWVCQLCQKEFFKRNRCLCLDHSVKKHKLDSGPYEFFCNLCGVGYNNKYDLKVHHLGKRHKKKLTESEKYRELLSTFHNNPRFEVSKEMKKIGDRWHCQLCVDNFKKKCTCLRHLVMQHSIQIPFTYVCNLCNKGFFRKYTMEEHTKTKMHKLRCRRFKMANDTNNNYVALEYFLIKNAENSFLKGPKTFSLINEPKSGYGKRLFVDGKCVCKICKAIFESIAECNEHLDKIHKVKVAKQTCESCQLTFYKDPKNVLQKHLRSKKHLLRVMENISRTPNHTNIEQSLSFLKRSVSREEQIAVMHKTPIVNIEILRENDTYIKEDVKNDLENSIVTISDASVSPPASLSDSINTKISTIMMDHIYDDASKVNNQQDRMYLDIIENETISLCKADSSSTKVLLLEDSKCLPIHVVKEEYLINSSLSNNRINGTADHLSQAIGDLNCNDKLNEEINPSDEVIVNMKFVCDDPRLGKSKVISLPANKPIKKAIKKFGKVVGLRVDNLQFRVNDKDLDLSVGAKELCRLNLSS